MVPGQEESVLGCWRLAQAGPLPPGRNQGIHRGMEGSPVRSSEASGPWISDLRSGVGIPQVSALTTYPLPSIELSSSSSRSSAGLVRGGHDRVDTFLARTEPLG